MSLSAAIPAQPAYLFFRPGNAELELVADYQSEIGHNTMSVDVFHNRELRFAISPYTSRIGLEALASDQELERQLKAIKAAYTCEWDGSNYVGRYDGMDDDAFVAITDSLRDKLSLQDVYLAEDWMDQDEVIASLQEHGSIAAYAAALIDRCETVVIGDMAKVVADTVAREVSHYIRFERGPSELVLGAIHMLRDFDADEYGYLLDDYRDEFQSSQA